MSEPKPKTSARKKAPDNLDKDLDRIFGVPVLTPEEEMAVETGSEMQWIDYQLLDDNPYQPRITYDPAEMDELKASMNTVGQIQPGVCRPHPTKPGRFQIAVAHRRTRAVSAGANAGTGRKNAHLYIGKVWFRVTELTDMEMRVLATRENTDRVDLNPMELADTYSSIRSALGVDGRKLTWQEVSKITGLGYRQMKRYADLLELPEAAQKKIRDKIWNERHGRAILSFESGSQIQGILIGQMVREGLSGAASEKRAGALRSAHATQRELDIATTAQQAHTTTVAAAAAKSAVESRATAQSGGGGHLQLVPPADNKPAPGADSPAADSAAETSQAGASAAGTSRSLTVGATYTETGGGQFEPATAANDADTDQEPEPEEIEATTPPAFVVVDPVQELHMVSHWVKAIAADVATTAVIPTDIEEALKAQIQETQFGLSEIIRALAGLELTPGE